MGNIDSRAKNSAGYLILQTTQPYYEPGSAITGNIYLRTLMPLPSIHIEFLVKGKENCSFLVFFMMGIDNPDRTVSLKRVHEKKNFCRDNANLLFQVLRRQLAAWRLLCPFLILAPNRPAIYNIL